MSPQESLPTPEIQSSTLVPDIKVYKKKIHPIIIYPFAHPSDTKHVKALYEGLVAPLAADCERYSRPITVMNRQTHYINTLWKYNPKLKGEFTAFRDDCVARYSKIIDAWCVDTCQMWLVGLGAAFDEMVTGDDAYWLIPGDFEYAVDEGPKVLELLEKLPEAVIDHDQDICLGEIDVPVNSSKHLIDTYGTYGLLYNWFPQEAKEIRDKTDKPRTEFFAISHSFLKEVLRQRWFAYEQTIVILLQAILGKKQIHKERLGKISDLPQGRDTLSAAMQQVERTERVLKLFWRERNQQQADWSERFKKLDSQSGQIRGAALVILENLLVYP